MSITLMNPRGVTLQIGQFHFLMNSNDPMHVNIWCGWNAYTWYHAIVGTRWSRYQRFQPERETRDRYNDHCPYDAVNRWVCRSTFSTMSTSKLRSIMLTRTRPQYRQAVWGTLAHEFVHNVIGRTLENADNTRLTRRRPESAFSTVVQ